MECTLAALIACFSWSNLYLDNQISFQDTSIPYFYWKDVSPPARTDGVRERVFNSTIGYESQNPYLRNAIGLQIRFRRIDVSAEVFHDSSMSSDRDRGINGFALRARWFPFR